MGTSTSVEAFDARASTHVPSKTPDSSSAAKTLGSHRMTFTLNDSKSVLVTGATSGLGRALALAILALPSQPVVIATGRRSGRLEELAATGIKTVAMDLTANKDVLKAEFEQILARFPELDSVVLCAGIQREFDFTDAEQVDLDQLADEMNINYVSTVAVIKYLLPHFKKLSDEGRNCHIIVVSSGLAMVPAPWVPNYSASKAALHSFSMALRAQLVDTNICVMEVFPPLVESELHDASGTTEKLSKSWMPLSEFTELTMPLLTQGDRDIPIGMSAQVFEKFEAGKSAMAIRLQANHKAGKGY